MDKNKIIRWIFTFGIWLFGIFFCSFFMFGLLDKVPFSAAVLGMGISVIAWVALMKVKIKLFFGQERRYYG